MSSNEETQAQVKETFNAITGVGVSGFKSLKKYTFLPIRPLTILAGANSSGKSSIMQPLLLLKQTLEVSYDPGPLLLYGPNARFTSAKQFLSKMASNRQVNKFSISIETSNKEKLATTYKNEPEGIIIESMKVVNNIFSIIVKPDMDPKTVINKIPYFKAIADSFNAMNRSVEWKIVRKQGFLYIQIETIFDLPFLGNSNDLFGELIRQVIHVPCLRGNPTRTYKTTAIGNVFPGTFEVYVASIIHYWQRNKDPRLKELEGFLARLGLTKRIEARQMDDTQVELQIGRLSKKKQDKPDMVNIADVGLGVSQVLPVLVALLTAEPGQLVYIEQPEIHLHPRAQAELARILAEATQKDIRLVVETHSDLFLTAVQTTVAKGEVEADKIILHWFQQNDEGLTTIASAELDELGAFGDWPEDFAEVDLTVESEYLEAVEKRMLEEADD